MTGYFQKTVMILTMAFCLWSGAAVETRAGILAAAQGSFNPVMETSVPPAPVSTDLDRCIQTRTPMIMQYESNREDPDDKTAIDYQDGDFFKKIRIIGEVAGKNIIFTDSIPVNYQKSDYLFDGVKKKATLDIKNVPWNKALNLILGSQNTIVAESGNTIAAKFSGTYNRVRGCYVKKKIYAQIFDRGYCERGTGQGQIGQRHNYSPWERHLC